MARRLVLRLTTASCGASAARDAPVRPPGSETRRQRSPPWSWRNIGRQNRRRRPPLGICSRPSTPLAARGTPRSDTVNDGGRGGTRRSIWGVWSTHSQPRSAATRVARSCFTKSRRRVRLAWTLVGSCRVSSSLLQLLNLRFTNLGIVWRIRIRGTDSYEGQFRHRDAQTR